MVGVSSLAAVQPTSSSERIERTLARECAAVHYCSLYLRSASGIIHRGNCAYALINYYYLTVDTRARARVYALSPAPPVRLIDALVRTEFAARLRNAALLNSSRAE